MKARTLRKQLERYAWLHALAALTACASPKAPSARDVADANDTGGTLAARNQGERQLLTRVASLPSGSPQQVAGLSVVAEAPYTAASGRTCRALAIRDRDAAASRPRVACSGDGKTWFFVPDVFSAAGQE